jgi:hypothetical protein
MSDQPVFGGYDRDEEDEVIHQTPPAAVGGATGETIADDLEGLFEVNDAGRYKTYPAVALNGAELLLEFDGDLDGEELARYQKIAAGNRAARRNGNTGDSKPWLSAAAMLSEKSTKITNKATGKVYKDADGHDMTLTSEEWLKYCGFPKDPVAANLKFFKFPQIVALGNAYMRDTGIENEPERIDPTPA